MLKEWTPDQVNSTWAKNIDGICQDVSSVLEEWTPDEVSTWTNNIEGIHKDVSSVLKENEITGQNVLAFNSLTSTCVPAGTKNSRSEDFLLAKHTSHKHPHHDEPFSHLASMVSMDEHTPPPGASSQGVGRGRPRRV